jgi:hypothetical protein
MATTTPLARPREEAREDRKRVSQAIEEAKRESMVVAKEARQKEKEAKAAKQKENSAVEQVKQKDVEAREAKQKAALAGDEALRKEKEAEEAVHRVLAVAEEVRQKEKEAANAKLRAYLAAEAVRQRVKQARYSKSGAKLISGQTQSREKKKVREGRQPEESGSAVTTPDEVSSCGKSSSHNDMDVLSGPVTLMINPAVISVNIMELISSLSENPDLQIVSMGGVAGRGSRIGLFIKRPMRLGQVFHEVADVQQVEVARKGNEIQIKMHAAD